MTNASWFSCVPKKCSEYGKFALFNMSLRLLYCHALRSFWPPTEFSEPKVLMHPQGLRVLALRQTCLTPRKSFTELQTITKTKTNQKWWEKNPMNGVQKRNLGQFHFRLLWPSILGDICEVHQRLFVGWKSRKKMSATKKFAGGLLLGPFLACVYRLTRLIRLQLHFSVPRHYRF